ncbi:MAG: glycosyltransferase family 2 protein [Bacillota bacterium]
MAKYWVVGVCQIYNELRKENLERFVEYFKPLVNDLVVYDDGSTDGSYQYMLEHTPHVINGKKNDFANERRHKQILLQKALKLNPDFLLWLDADEVMTANAGARLQEMCHYCLENQIDGLSFHELNLWRSSSWRRIDSLFNDGWFVRLWRVTPGMAYSEIKPGLHQIPFPSNIKKIEAVPDVKVLHYGFSSEKRLAYKYLVYQSHGQSGYVMLDRLIDERSMVLEKVPPELFPDGLWVDDPQPAPITWEEALSYVERYREEVFRP